MIMKFLQLCVWSLMVSALPLWAMKPQSIADLKVESKLVKSLKTDHGMRVDERVISFTQKTTGNYVAGLTYFVFDCSESKNEEQDRKKISAFVRTIFTEKALQGGGLFEIGVTLNEYTSDVKASLLKKRKHGDVGHGFKKYVLPIMRSKGTVVFAHTLHIMRDYQVGGLGKQIMGYMFLEFLECYPQSISFWIAHPFSQSSKNKMSFSDLETFYKQCGCTVAQDGSGFCYVDITKFDLSFFKPKKKIVEQELLKSKI